MEIFFFLFIYLLDYIDYIERVGRFFDSSSFANFLIFFERDNRCIHRSGNYNLARVVLRLKI